MENKYIIINNILDLIILEHRMKSVGFLFKDSIENIIQFVKDSDGYDVELDNYEEHLDYEIGEKMILVFNGYEIFYRRFQFKDDYDDWDNYEYYNVQKLLREEKLLRILD